MKENRLIAKNSVILFFRLFITTILGLYSTRLVVNGLGASDYGLYTIVGGIVIMLTFINSGMHTATFRFVAYEMGKENGGNVNEVFNISIFIHIILSLIVLLLTETIGVYYVNNHLNVDPVKINDALYVLRFSTYSAMLGIIGIPFNGLITANEKFNVQASIEIIRTILSLAAAICISIFVDNKLRLYALLMMFAQGMPALLFLLYCKIKYSDYIKWNFQKLSKKHFEMFSFAGWTMLGAASTIGRNQGSALIINSFFGPVLNASFGIANQINSFVSILSRNLGQAAIPQITKSYSQDNMNRSISLASYISKYSMFLMLIIAIPVLLNTNYIINIWIGEAPEFTVIFSRLMIINALIEGIGSSGITSLVQANGKIKYFQIFTSLVSLSSLPIAYLLFKLGYNPSFITIAYISTASINVIIKQILLNKIIKLDVKKFINISYLKVLSVVTLSIPLFFIKWLIVDDFIAFMIVSTFVVCWLLISMYIVGVENFERLLINSTLKKLLSRKQLKN